MEEKINNIIWICRTCGEEFIKIPIMCKICGGKEFQKVTYEDLNMQNKLLNKEE